MPSPNNRRTALLLSLLVVGMVGMSFASVPLYRLFCQVTGFGGTTQKAPAAPPISAEVNRTISITFNADTNPELPWNFKPLQHEVSMPIGKAFLAHYEATNEGGIATTGTATFNVLPLKVGKYFKKIECFCFTEQTLQAGQRVDMPVSFFIDPALATDPEMADVKNVVLSYTFFKTYQKK
jgi:cytochrome c oxidase assembly protein subunit 11